MNSTLTFYIARHGKTLLNTLERVQGWCDSPLTDEGIEVAKYLARGFNKENITFRTAYCSDLRRTKQTTDVILKEKGQTDIEITEMEGLRETCFGSYESDFNMKMWTDVAIYFHYVSPELMYEALLKKEITYKEILGAITKLDRLGSAENYEQVKERVYNSLINIVKREETKGDGNILIVSHGMSILVLMWALDGGHMIKGHLENAAVCKVIYQDGNFHIESIGDMKYVNIGKE